MARIGFKHKLTVLLGGLATLVFAGGCSFRYLPAVLESPGRLKVNDLANSYHQFDCLCVGDCKVLTCDPEKAERVGHVLGAYQEYTMKLTKEGPLPRKCANKNAKQENDAVSLMKIAFDKLCLDAVEFDVHVNRKQKNESKVFILHYEPPWTWLSSWPESKPFIDDPKNTLTGLLEIFFKVYSGKGKRLYVELKAPKQCQDNGKTPTVECTDSVKRVAAVLEQQWSSLNKKNERTVAFVSFSTQMLEAMHDALSKKLGKAVEFVDFILILGPSNRDTAILASIPKGWVPDFDKDEIKWLKHTDWIDGVWYSPRVIKDFPTKIFEINRERDQDLFVGISVYQQKRKDFMKSVRDSWLKVPGNFPVCDSGQRKAPALVRSFIFDIDSQGEPIQEAQCDSTACPDLREGSRVTGRLTSPFF